VWKVAIIDVCIAVEQDSSGRVTGHSLLLVLACVTYCQLHCVWWTLSPVSSFTHAAYTTQGKLLA